MTVSIVQPDPRATVQAASARVLSLPKQVRYAASLAANASLGQARQAVQQRMSKVFDRPTPYVVRGATAITNTTRDNLTGTIALATTATDAGNLPPGKPLRAEVQGGARRLKRSELLLQRAGVLPSGYLTVPGSNARLDAYGNMQRGQILEILAWFRTHTVRQTKDSKRNSWRDNLTDAGMARKRQGTRNRAGFEYFVAPPGDRRLKPGIYRRQLAGRFMGPVGQRPVLVMLFVRRTQYAQRLDFAARAEQALAAAFQSQFRAALRRALDTAR